MKVLLQKFLLLTSFGILALVSTNGQTPVASYSFSGNANDQSVNKNHATVHGAHLTKDRFGWANSAYSFDGKQSFIQAPNKAVLNSPYTTVSFWMYVTALPGQGEVYPLSFGGWQERWKISLPSHGKLVWTTNNSSGISDMDAGEANALKAGEWKHLVFVHDGTKDLIYINGVKVAEKNVSGTLNSTTRPLGMGYNPVDGGNFLNGILDEVMIYDIALGANQIADLYTAQNTPPAVAQGKVASYLFKGNTQDATSYANHAVGTDVKTATDRFGYGHSAFEFNGTSSKVVAPNSSHLNSDFTTISFWVRPLTFPASGEVYLLTSGGWQERWKISLPSHGKPVFTTKSDGKCCSDMDSGTPLTLGAWTQVVMVHDGTKNIIYFNGAKVAEKNVAGKLDSTKHPFGIGFNAVDGGNFFRGFIDDVEIYNYAMTGQQIADAYTAHSTFPGTATDLVAEYKFAGNAEDATQFKNHGTVSGATLTTDRHGYASNAYKFSGAQSVSAANSVRMNSDYATISFWVRPDEFPGTGEVFLLSNGGWQDRWKVSLPSHGKPVFTTKSDGKCCSDMDSGTPLTIGTWTHVVMVHDGAKNIIYFNGVKMSEKDVAGKLDKTTRPFGIGFDPIGNSGFFKGSIDEVQIYNKALTAAEIAALYAAQNTAPTFADKLVANYTFDGHAMDMTPFNNHGEVTGAQLTKDRFGKANKAYAFNGTTDKILAANSKQLNSDYATISFWANVAQLPPSGEYYLLSFGGWQERWKISLPGHGKPVFTTKSDGKCCSDMDSNPDSLKIGQWKHVVMVHDGTKNIIYFNGAKIAEKNVAGKLDKATKPLGIGFNAVDGGNFFKGSLDEIQIYNVALTDAEIAALYTAQSTAPAATDTIAPTAPQNLTAVVEFYNVALSWLPATDNVGVIAYNVYRDGAKVMTTSTLNAAFQALKPLTKFKFGVTAVDAAGNESLMTSLDVTTGADPTPDTTPPTKPGNLKATTGSHSVLLSWDPSTDDRQLKGYVVLLDGKHNDSLAANITSKLITGLKPQTLYTFEVYAYDASGNKSPIAEITVSTDKEIQTAEPGLVAHYSFEGDAKDVTPFANHGTVGGNPVFIQVTHPTGTKGTAIKFDGDRDSIFVANKVQLISDYTTVSFWVRVDGQNLADPEAYIINFGNWDQRWKISLPQHLKVVWTTNSKNAQFPNFISDMDSGTGNELLKGFWWYVTMVHDGQKDIIYIDGKEVNSKPVLGTLNSTSRPLIMGGIGNGGQYFNGALDEVKIYNKALTAAEIAKLHKTATTDVDNIPTDELLSVIKSLHPNPVDDVLLVEHTLPGTQPLLLRVYDLQGRQVDAQRYDSNTLSNTIKLNVDKYTPGTYFLNFIYGGKNLGSLKFNKQ